MLAREVEEPLVALHSSRGYETETSKVAVRTKLLTKSVCKPFPTLLVIYATVGARCGRYAVFPGGLRFRAQVFVCVLRLALRGRRLC